MVFELLKYGLSREYPARRLTGDVRTLNKHYDVVVIGGGGHGAAIAYYLAKDHGITNVAVLDKGYLGGGNTARNTAVLRSNYLTKEGVSFYKASMDLYEGLSNEFDFNILFERREKVGNEAAGKTSSEKFR